MYNVSEFVLIYHCINCHKYICTTTLRPLYIWIHIFILILCLNNTLYLYMKIDFCGSMWPSKLYSWHYNFFFLYCIILVQLCCIYPWYTWSDININIAITILSLYIRVLPPPPTLLSPIAINVTLYRCYYCRHTILR